MVLVTSPAQSHHSQLIWTWVGIWGTGRPWGGCDGSPPHGLYFIKGGGCGPINMTLVFIEGEGLLVDAMLQDVAVGSF